EEYMRGWYYALTSNVSVHEVWPGHYLQFLYAKNFPSDVRKVFGANTNSEGWAHYCEQMVIDEGFHADDPKYRLAQLQDALLRNARFIVGIKMHTRGMTMAEAQTFFQKEGYQPLPVAKSETKRGTSDATQDSTVARRRGVADDGMGRAGAPRADPRAGHGVRS